MGKPHHADRLFQRRRFLRRRRGEVVVSMISRTEARTILETLFRAAVAAADPARVVPPALPEPPAGRTVVVGAGKAAAGMAAAVEARWPGPLGGLVVTRYGHAATGARPDRIEVAEAGHPVPDAAGLEATQRLCGLVEGLSADDLVIALISGGGSALLAAPLPGITLADKIAVTRQLLACGAPISDVNTVRRHLSAVKGGRLAARAAPARVATLILPDVPGDAPELVASGPTVPGRASRDDALGVIDRFGLGVPARVRAAILADAARLPDPDDPRFARNTVRIVGSARLSLEAARDAARRLGLEAILLSDRVEGAAREAAREHAALALATSGGRRPIVLLSGGETSVTLRGTGRGGRNAEFALAAALALDGTDGVFGLAADTDGIDGSEDNAGAVFDGTTCARLRAAGRDPRALLDDNDSHAAFDALGDLLFTGPTGTNVNDFRALLIGR